MDQTFCKVGDASYSLIVLIVIIFFGSCASKKQIVEDDNEMFIQKFIPVTVKNAAGLDGCSFLLVKDSVTSFQPVEFSDSLKLDGLKLWIKFSVVNQMSVCMAGQTIKLAAVKYRKK
jgi:hypothetical protein